MKAITRRLSRLEDQFWPPAPQAADVLSCHRPDGRPDALAVRRFDREPSFEKATCKRTLCADGTLWEVVHLDKIYEDGDQPTDDELNRWIAGFPIEPLRSWQTETRAQ
jgi:hypothetical protein